MNRPWVICLSLFFLHVMPGIRAVADDNAHPSFPRLFGMQIGGPARYDHPAYQQDLARFDVLVLNFWPEWKQWKYGPEAMTGVLRNIRARNTGILIGQYTNLNEAKPSDDPDPVNRDIATKLDQQGWWLRDIAGQRVRWTRRYGAFDINVSGWTRPDSSGQRYSEWYADRNFRVYFENNPDLQFWYLDNSLPEPAVRSGDWNLDGRLDDSHDPSIAREYRLGHLQYWRRIRQLQPNTLLLGNSPDLSSPEYSGKLQGAFLEALIGKSWSTETRQGWQVMMARYHDTMQQVSAPAIVGFGVSGPADDYQRLRYGLASCLLGDGYFSYDDSNADHDYANVAWFDEFDLDLGRPLEPPVKTPWQSGTYRRRFERGMAIVNPTDLPARIEIEAGYQRFTGRQDPAVNNGNIATRLVLPSRDGIILLRLPAGAPP